PGLGAIDDRISREVKSVDCLLVDGTFWTEDEMISMGVGSKRAREIGHLPQSGPGGMIEWLRGFGKGRGIRIHINNTKPDLDEASAEGRTLEREGIEVAFDGMELAL